MRGIFDLWLARSLVCNRGIWKVDSLSQLTLSQKVSVVRDALGSPK